MTVQCREAQIEQLVSQHRRQVDHIVDRFMRRYYVGGIEREDLVSFGLLGLYQAAQAWDRSRNLKFSTLAWRVIERAIIRGVRREWRPEEAQVTVSLDELLFPFAPEGGEESSLGQTLPDSRAEATTRALDTTVMLRTALNCLPAEQQELIRQRYYEGRSCAEIGERSGKSRQTIHLREKAILRQLRRDLGANYSDLAAA
jgi:RNA polymerase sigma factor for flagellar operon FliA